jgi:C-terminal processing protease CtpA/Prc
MASLNNVDALIVDLRDNGGGFGETALQIAGYLFDRPNIHVRSPSELSSSRHNRIADFGEPARRQARVRPDVVKNAVGR